MHCPECKSNDFLTIDSRDYFNNRIRRKKKCDCGYKWVTIEYIENERNKKNKPKKHCQYLGCNKPTFAKGNCTKYCIDHKRAWKNFHGKIERARKKGLGLPEIPIQFNRKKGFK